MINFDGIFNALIQQWEQAPSMTRVNFCAQVETQGIATAEDANLYVTNFLSMAQSLALIDDTTWATLQARVAEVGLERAVTAGRIVHERVIELADARVDRLQGNIDALQAEIDEATRVRENALSAKPIIESQFPASQVREDTLVCIDRGATILQGLIDSANLHIERYQAEIDRIEGTGG